MTLNKFVSPFIMIICCLAALTTLHSQDIKKLSPLVKETMDLRRQEKYWSGLSPFKDYIAKYPAEMIKSFKPYTSDTLEIIRSLAFDAIGVTGQKATNLKIRQSAVDILVDGCMDKEAALRKNVSKMLSHYKKEDFTVLTTQKLTALLNMEDIYYQHVVKLIGFLDLKSEIPSLQALLDSGQIKNRSLEWDIQLSLARLGEKDAVKHSVDLVRNAGLNDKVVYNLFPDLTYTRSKEAVDYMIEILNKDSKDCFSPNPDNPVKISCAYRVLEFLAPIIKDFPLKKDKDGELDIDDYEKALSTCREWFKIHANDYVVDRERF